jgi:hypothetical protein
MIFEAFLQFAVERSKKALKKVTMPKIHRNLMIAILAFNYLNLNHHSLSLIKTLSVNHILLFESKYINLTFKEYSPNYIKFVEYLECRNANIVAD